MSEWRVLRLPVLAILALGFAFFAGVVSSACGGKTDSALKVGDPAPAFTLVSTDGATVSLNDYLGKTSVLLYFSMGAG